MDDGYGRDIAPNEDRLPPPNNLSNGHTSLSSHDLQEDTVHTTNYHQGRVTVRHETVHGLQSRDRYHLHEPMDTTPDAVGSIEQRVFPPQRRQASNASNYYKSEMNRLTTFSDWRHQSIVRKEDLAKNGFVYTGTADKVGFCSKCTCHQLMFSHTHTQTHNNYELLC